MMWVSAASTVFYPVKRKVREANCVIAVAGMEGALASVIGGLVANPVIAVPTSVGYGASFHGLSALFDDDQFLRQWYSNCEYR